MFTGAVVLPLAHAAGAAPKAGPPFTLADADAPAEGVSIAGNARGYLLAWSSGGSIFAQHLRANASRSRAREEVATRDVTASGTKEYGGARVVANAADYLLKYGYSSTSVPSDGGAPVLVGTDFAMMAFSETGAIAPSRMRISGPSAGARTLHAGVTSASGDGFALMELSVVFPFANPLAALTFTSTSGSAEGPQDGPFPYGGGLSAKLLDMASNGVRAIAAVGGDTGASLVRFDEGTLQVLPGFIDASNVLLAHHDSMFIVVAESAGKIISVRTTGDVPGRSPPSVVLTSQDAGAESLLAIEPAGQSLLVLTAVTGTGGADGGSVLRVRRLTYDGVVLDPEGIDVAEGSEGDLARADGEHWLLATHETLDGKERIVGRYIGEGELPPPPPDVPPPDGGTPPEADGGEGAGGSGTGGRSSAGGTGGSSSGGSSRGSGGKRADASDGDAPPKPAPGDDGCACETPRRGRADAAWFVAAGVAWAASRRRRRPA